MNPPIMQESTLQENANIVLCAINNDNPPFLYKTQGKTFLFRSDTPQFVTSLHTHGVLNADIKLKIQSVKDMWGSLYNGSLAIFIKSGYILGVGFDSLVLGTEDRMKGHDHKVIHEGEIEGHKWEIVIQHNTRSIFIFRKNGNFYCEINRVYTPSCDYVSEKTVKVCASWAESEIKSNIKLNMSNFC